MDDRIGQLGVLGVFCSKSELSAQKHTSYTKSFSMPYFRADRLWMLALEFLFLIFKEENFV